MRKVVNLCLDLTEISNMSAEGLFTAPVHTLKSLGSYLNIYK